MSEPNIHQFEDNAFYEIILPIHTNMKCLKIFSSKLSGNFLFSDNYIGNTYQATQTNNWGTVHQTSAFNNDAIPF